MKRYLVGARMRTVKYGICWLCSLIQDIQDNSLILASINNHEIAEFLVVMNDYMVKHVKSEWSLKTANILITYFFRLFPIDKNFIEKYETDLKNALNDCLKDRKWMIGNFLSIAVGYRCLSEMKKYYFYEELDNKIRFFKKINEDIQVVEQLANSERYIRPLNIADLIKIETEAKIYFSEKIFILYSNIHAADVFRSELAMDLLEISQSTKGKTIGTFNNSKVICSENNIEIDNEMAKLIRFDYYKLDKNFVEKGIFPVSRYSAQEVASLLNISKDELIALCFGQCFGVYIKEGNYKIHRSVHSPIIREDISQTEEPTYPYFYKGHFRLQKTSRFYSEDSTLEKIYKGGAIEVPAGRDYIFVPIQPSLSELIQGEHILLELRGNQKIAIDDLVFIKDEIDEYIKRRDFCSNESDKILSDKNVSPVEIENNAFINDEKTIKKNGNTINHHAKKRTALLRAATAITYRYDITSGKDVLGLIKDNISSFFDGKNELPHSDRVNTDLINKYLRPLSECEFNEKAEKPFEEERIFGAALSIVHHHKNQLNSINRDKASAFVAEKIFSEKQLLNISLSLDYIKGIVSDAFFQIT